MKKKVIIIISLLFLSSCICFSAFTKKPKKLKTNYDESFTVLADGGNILAWLNIRYNKKKWLHYNFYCCH